MKLGELVPREGVLFRLSAIEVQGVIAELASELAKLHGLDAPRAEKALFERELLGSTALGHGIAAPHAKLDIPRTVGILGLAPHGIDFDAPDGEPVRIFVALLSPLHGGEHLKALSSIARELSDAAVRRRILEAANADEVHAILSGSHR